MAIPYYSDIECKGSINAEGIGADLKKVLVDMFYPVGSIYFSVKSTNPSSKWGGTWVAWGAGRVPVGVDSSTEFNKAENKGGERTHTLTTTEMPKHTHTQDAHNHSVSESSHTHGVYSVDDYTANCDGLGLTGGYIGGLASASKDKDAGYYTDSTKGTKSNKIPYIQAAYTGVSVVSTIATNQETGSSASHNNLQPYITCYMWKRTA